MTFNDVRNNTKRNGGKEVACNDNIFQNAKSLTASIGMVHFAFLITQTFFVTQQGMGLGKEWRKANYLK